eukprot:gene22264-28377_t
MASKFLFLVMILMMSDSQLTAPNNSEQNSPKGSQKSPAFDTAAAILAATAALNDAQLNESDNDNGGLGDWMEFFTDDEEIVRAYYYNMVTGETVWERPQGIGQQPAKSPPPVPVCPAPTSSVFLPGYKADIDTAIAKSPLAKQQSSSSGGSRSPNPFGGDDEDASIQSNPYAPEKNTFNSSAVEPPNATIFVRGAEANTIKNNMSNTTTSSNGAVLTMGTGLPRRKMASYDDANAIVASVAVAQKAISPVGTSSSNPFGDDEPVSTGKLQPVSPSASGGGGWFKSKATPAPNAPLNAQQKAAQAQQSAAREQNDKASNSKGVNARAGGSSLPSTAVPSKHNPFNPFAADDTPAKKKPHNPFADDDEEEDEGSVGMKTVPTPLKKAPLISSNSSNPFDFPDSSPPIALAPAPAKQGSFMKQVSQSASTLNNGVKPPIPVAVRVSNPIRKSESGPVNVNRYGTNTAAPPPPTRNPSGARPSPLMAAAERPAPAADRTPVGQLNRKSMVSPQDQLSSTGNCMSQREFGGLTPETQLLLRIGVKPFHATTNLSENNNDPYAALKAINRFLVDSIHADPYNTQLSIWGPRITTRIKSWLPNIMENNKQDYHTAYICVINYVSPTSTRELKPWSLSLRYSAFAQFEKVVSRHCRATRIHAEFPHATGGQFLFGISDEVRNDRMAKFDTWLREVLVNPVLMTTREVFEEVNRFLEVDSHITEG